MMYYRVFSLILLLFSAERAFALVELQDISFAELSDNRIEIRTLLSSKDAVPLVLPKGYVIEKPARIVLDLPDVLSKLSRKKYELNLGNLKSAVILTAQNRTRMIFNLSDAASFSNIIKDNVLVTTIDNSLAVNKSYTRTQTNEAPPLPVASVGNQITDIDFRRGGDGAGKILLTLSNPKVSVDVERLAGDITMRFSDVQISEQLQRRLDVIDFSTPVQFIETRSGRDSVTVSVEAKGEYDYLAYQADGVYVVSIAPLSKEEVEEKQALFQYVGEKLSLNFQDIEVRKVLEIIADFTDLNLVASDTVSGNITLRLENVPWDQALELVLKSKGLDKRQAGNVLLVAPAAEIAERERQELESKKQLQELEPLVTEFVRVRYATAADVSSLIQAGDSASSINSTLSSRGSVVVDERTNSIVVSDIAENIEGIKTLISQVDIPVRQVMIEARIVSASDSFRRELGFSFTGNQAAVAGEGTDILGGDLDVSVPTTQAATGTLGVTYLPGTISLGLEITALENAGYGEVISQPRILTGDKQTAKIESGQQIPFTTTTGTTSTTTFQDAVLSLEVTPQITPDNRIIMELKVNRDSLDGDTITASGSPINVTELTTTALVADGDTIVLGGIFEQTKSTSESKVPLLGDLPVVGRLFRSSVDIDDRSELLIFITPRILADDILDN